MQSQDPCENCPLLLPSLRLFIPPLRLVSAAMWQVVQRGDVQDYGMLEEFVTMVTEIVPELWSCSQRAQLLLGLRARLVLELCRTEQTLDLTNIQKHLDRIRSLTSTGEAESNDAEVQLSESNFVELVESLLKDPSERENFYQDVFPVEFGPKYDTAIQMLMLEFLSRFEKLLPIPDLEQTASLLNAVPSALEKCLQFVPDPIQLRTLLQYHRKHGHLDSIRPPLLLPSLRLFIPPLRLVSAAMWQVVQRGDVQDYGMLEEFVTTVTDIVPELLSCSQRAQLILGLRARMVLELCRTEQTADQDIQQHLDRIRSLISTGEAESGDAEVELSESNFVELVESLLKDPSERENFYQI
eukprot:XP_014009295.1 PREDICTED: uncharacterized protein LOC106576584 isoform X4 [Salmo salar]